MLDYAIIVISVCYCHSCTSLNVCFMFIIVKILDGGYLAIFVDFVFLISYYICICCSFFFFFGITMIRIELIIPPFTNPLCQLALPLSYKAIGMYASSLIHILIFSSLCVLATWRISHIHSSACWSISL